MPLTIIAGGQFGSEGKGKATAYLAQRDDVDIVVRCGSTNSGHTVWHGGEEFQLRMIPAGFVNERTTLMLAPGCLIDVAVLRAEAQTLGIDRDRLIVDRNTSVIEVGDIEAERISGLRDDIGSTLSGVGSAVARRVWRKAGTRTVADVPELTEVATIADVSTLVNKSVGDNARVIIEGTQGYGLSLYHTPEYPFATSRDTTAAGFLSEVGVGPRRVDEVILAVRTFPIRVAGNSGPLPSEITWDDVTRESGSPHAIIERTTTTHRVRRVARFDLDIVRRAAQVNSATSVALHGADYLDHRNVRASAYEELTDATRAFIEQLEHDLGIPVDLIGVGPKNEETIDRTVFP